VEIRTSNPASGSGTDKLAFGAGLYPFASIHATVWSYANTGVIWKVTKIGGNATTTTSTTATASTSSSTPALKTIITSSSLQKVTPAATIANKTSNQANANKSTITGSNNNTSVPSPIGIPGIP
jgi:hypothetical protein